MKKILFFISVTLSMTAFSRADAQQVNGQTFSFPKGKTEWSDTIYKKLLTKEMAKEGLKAVPIGIRYKFIKSVEEGNWYAIEISNQSPDAKVKFRVVEKHNQNAYTVSLDPKQTKVIRKLYLRSNKIDSQNLDDANSAYLNQLFDEMDETRY
jgi:CRISPR/Cas system-associated exonuclease Cas4 (RecB family)